MPPNCGLLLGITTAIPVPSPTLHTFSPYLIVLFSGTRSHPKVAFNFPDLSWPFREKLPDPFTC